MSWNEVLEAGQEQVKKEFVSPIQQGVGAMERFDLT